jgi:threonine dehydratase
VIAGQGTMALELLEDEAAIDVLLVPIGGGGLIGGSAVVVQALRPEIAVIGVQVAGYSALAQRRGANAFALGGATIAEGIAVPEVGRLTSPLIADLVQDILVVDEAAVEDAIAALAEGAKLVAEGAGAAALAALMTHRARFEGRRVAMPVCGGNIDMRILANVLLRGLLRDGRLLRLHLEVPDRPGVLAEIAGCIAASGGNIIEVNHQRLFAQPSVQAARLEVMVEARDPMHAETIRRALAARFTVARV